MLKLIIFDLDDTLCFSRLASEELPHCIFKFFEKTFFKTLTWDTFLSVYDETTKIYYSDNPNFVYTPSKVLFWEIFEQQSTLKLNTNTLYQLVNKSLQLYYQNLKVVPGVTDYLGFLQAQQILCVVASAGFWQWKADALKALDLLKYFDKIFASTNLRLSKGEGSMYRYIQDTYKLTPKEILVIGDDYKIDIQPPQSLGFHTIQVNFYEKVSTRQICTSFQQVLEKTRKLLNS